MSRAALPRFDIAVVGAGFSGLALARAWQEQGGEGAGSLALIGDAEGFGCGLAYGRAAVGAQLNTVAERMGLSESAPGEFADWLGLEGGARLAYPPREAYGAYLRSSLERLRVQCGEHLRCLEQGVVALSRQRGGFRLGLADGSDLLAREVVLAIGLPPAPLHPGIDAGLVASGRVLPDPWNPAAVAGIHPEATVLVLGSGLSMIDAVLRLQRQGHRGPILTLSRRGLLPVRHASRREPSAPPDPDVPLPRGTLRELFVSLRRCASEGGDWRAWIDALRPHLGRWWATLTRVERARFLRHLRPFWDAHRHRMPPEIADPIEDLVDSGQLQVLAGRLQSLRERRGRLALGYRRRGAACEETLFVDVAIQAIGSDTDVARSADPLLHDLRQRGLVAPDPLGWGLLTSAELEVLDPSGKTVPGLHCLGALARPALGELVAVPELRHAAARLAQRLLQN